MIKGLQGLFLQRALDLDRGADRGLVYDLPPSAGLFCVQPPVRVPVQVGVSPENGPEVVERAARALGLPADTVFRLRVLEGNAHQLSAPPACAQCSLT